jgi:hypothetical protein
MTSNAGCWRRRRVALALATIWLSGCATGASDGDGPGACPPVITYDRAFLERAADELEMPPAGSAIEQILADYAVTREQLEAGTSR